MKPIKLLVIFTISGIATLYARWALEGHIDANALFLISSICIAPPVFLYEIKQVIPVNFFWFVFIVLEFFYIFLLWQSISWVMHSAIKKVRNIE